MLARYRSLMGSPGRKTLEGMRAPSSEPFVLRPVPAALVTLAVVAVAAGLGQALAGDDPFAALDAYRQPSFALPPSGWVAVGIAYYLAMMLIVFRLLRRLPSTRTAVCLVAAVMVGNEAWNVLVFGIRSPWGAFVGVVAFAVLVATALERVRRHDAITALALGLYLLWVVAYDIPWTLALARIN